MGTARTKYIIKIKRELIVEKVPKKKNISDMNDIEYFQHRLFEALKVPKRFLGNNGRFR